MYIDVIRIKISNDKVKKREISKVRGFIASNNLEIIDLHNHLDNNQFNYGYPVIQYKTIAEQPYIIAIGESSKKLVLEAVFSLGNITLSNKEVSTSEKAFFVEKKEFGCDRKFNRYRFLSPWMALNQNNYSTYIKANEDERSNILKKILIGNILSMSKKMNYTVGDEIKIFLNLQPIKVNFKNNEMLSFVGEFLANFIIPDYFGIGKSASRGFGTIKKIDESHFI